MKKYYPKSIFAKTLCVLLFAALIFVIHSCRKDIAGEQALTDPKIIQAKAWYENAYPKNNNITPGTYTTMSTGSSGHGQTDLSQMMSPDWQHNASYNRMNSDVIEMPIDASSKLRSSFSKDSPGNA